MRILIVDDDPLTLEVLSEVLSRQPGCETETASSGLEALCRVLIGDIDLVITDWQMPGMNGLDLCRNIRKCDQGKYVYVVLITGHGDEQSVIEGLNAGADEFLTKPVGPSELMARVWSIRRMKGFHDELQLRNRELKESQQFKNDWIDLVVNAIRSPVSTVLGFSELAASKATPRLRPHVEKVSREARWIDTMLKQMLVVARSADGGLKPSRSQVNLQALVTSTCRSLSAVADSKNVRLVAFCPQGEFIAEVDVPLIQGALENLLANAIRHSPHESTVVVELRQENDEILLAVADQGPGMPSETRQKLFDSSSGETQAARPQPCLGLAYCQTVTAAHEGRISCESNQPTGTRFEIRLPISSPVVGDFFDPVAFASTLPQDEILPFLDQDESRDDTDIETAVDSRLVLVPGPDSPLPS
jgi:signal transduction histidine kinase